MTEPSWQAPGSQPPAAAPPGSAAPPPGYAAPPPGYAAPPPGYAAPPPGWVPPVVEFRPGIIPLRPLGLSDIYGAVTKTIRGNPGATIGLATVVMLAFLVPTTALGVWLASRASMPKITDDSRIEEVFTSNIGSLLSSVPSSLGTLLATVVLTGFVAWIIGQAVMGRRVKAAETFSATLPSLLRLLGATMLGFLISLVVFGVPIVLLALSMSGVDANAPSREVILGFLGRILLALVVIVPLALWLSTRLAFIAPAIVLERAGVLGSYARSWRLTSGSQFWRVLGIRLLTSLIVGVMSQAIAIPLALLPSITIAGSGDLSTFLMVNVLVSALSGLIVGSLTTPISAGVDALLYVDQRIRREGLDVELIASMTSHGPT